MDIILLERVEKLGAIGDVVTVKDGYARNFLLPNKKALRANDANRKVFEANRSKIESDNASRRDEAQKASGTVEGKQIVLIRAASQTGQLYGSVSVKDIVDGLVAQDAKVTKGMIVLERPIKTLGIFGVKVVLHPEVASDAADAAEAAANAKRREEQAAAKAAAEAAGLSAEGSDEA